MIKKERYKTFFFFGKAAGLNIDQPTNIKGAYNVDNNLLKSFLFDLQVVKLNDVCLCL